MILKLNHCPTINIRTFVCNALQRPLMYYYIPTLLFQLRHCQKMPKRIYYTSLDSLQFFIPSNFIKNNNLIIKSKGSLLNDYYT